MKQRLFRLARLQLFILTSFQRPVYMLRLNSKILLLAALACAGLSASGCGRDSSSGAAGTFALAPPPAAPLAGNARTDDAAVRMLEERVERDPEDFAALNRLAGYYLQHARETGSADYIELATRAAHRSLASVPEVRNAGGLATLAQAEFAAHEFTAARDHAIRLTELDPGRTYPYGLLCDALIELGDYDEAARVLKRMEGVKSGINEGSETRRARLAFLRGDVAGARRHLTNALALALNLPVPQREAVAWYRWQLGEIAFAVGDYPAAERHYHDALTTFPDYYRALAGLGRVSAARGDMAESIEHFEHVVRLLPDPTFVATLGDLYKLAGREKDAAAQYALVEQIARLNKANGVLYNRQLALFYANHDLKAEEAYASAVSEYQIRRDIYGADAVAWAALKAGKVSEAQATMREALRLGTQDAVLLYHAGMIARAAGDKSAARDYLSRALALNPQFDALQAPAAAKALEDLS